MDEVMASIKNLAVREENTMVARVQLHNVRQDRDETIRSFSARLRGQASVCKFLIKCPVCDVNVNYTVSIIRDVVTRRAYRQRNPTRPSWRETPRHDIRGGISVR